MEILRIDERYQQAPSFRHQCKVALEIAAGDHSLPNYDGRFIGMGHNRPPIEDALNSDQVIEANEAIDQIRVEVANAYVDRIKTGIAVSTLIRIGDIISAWIIRRTEELSSNATKVVGTGLGAWFISKLANWEIVVAKINELVAAASNMVK